jgi:hypothetical protein
MKPRISYLLAHGRQDAQTFNVPFVTFTPAADAGDREKSFEDGGTYIGVYDGFFPYDSGGEARPSFVLESEFLMGVLEQLDLSWFVQFLERMARGEYVGLDEVQTAYRDLHGRAMESSVAPPLKFAFMGR